MSHQFPEGGHSKSGAQDSLILLPQNLNPTCETHRDHPSLDPHRTGDFSTYKLKTLIFLFCQRSCLVTCSILPATGPSVVTSTLSHLAFIQPVCVCSQLHHSWVFTAFATTSTRLTSSPSSSSTSSARPSLSDPNLVLFVYEECC